MDWVGFEAPGAEMLIIPVHSPAGNADVLIWTLTALGVALLCGDTTSQLLPHEDELEYVGVAVKLMVPPPAAVTFSVCAVGAVVPN